MLKYAFLPFAGAEAEILRALHPFAFQSGNPFFIGVYMPTTLSIAHELWTADEFLDWLEPGVFADLIDGEIELM
jgi:hypothetical protein